MIAREAIQNTFDEEGLGNAGFSTDDDAGTEGVIVGLYPPVVIWLARGRVELRADLDVDGLRGRGPVLAGNATSSS